MYSGSSSEPMYGASSAPTAKEFLLPRDGVKKNSASYDVEAGMDATVYAADLELGLRMAFIRKVYGVLLLQILVTAAFCALAKTSATMQSFILTSGNVMVCFVLSIALLCALFALRQVHPWNVVCLGAWTIVMADMVSVSVLAYSVSSVFLALGITFAIFLGLSAYTLQSKRDFSGLGVALYAGLVVLLVVVVVQLFFPVSSAMSTMIAVFGAVLFSGFIVYDTWLMMTRLSVDDWVVASVNLYLDVLNLFMYVLQIIGDRN
eukprot:TRINITY_DN2235_c0_g1_i1.p1 TRINITY_DN2235_c0_g1~~TRINITY_DN2235_c0_g1_i1.p1  ORF type:complete len:284 (+),score=43.92 TRINITY_DN2235_c0_g1_i1:67-852(+)